MRIRLLLSTAVVLLGACRKPSEEGVLARVGGSAITEAEFRRKLSEVAPDYQNYVLTPNGRRQFLDVLIREKMILEAARADGVTQTPEFTQRMEELRKEEAERMAEARDYLATRLWLEQLRRAGAIKVTDDEVRDYHRKNPREVLVRHILLPTAQDAEETMHRLRAGARFASVAQKISLDADTASEGGLMKPMLPGEIIPELEGVFKMRVGELAGPIRSKLGYHVLLKESERSISLKDASDRIHSLLEKQKLDKHLQSLQGSFPVEVVDAQFK
ncbi:MAG TPA: peptidylprolyl isomerase [Elusimicrobiota bacterium]|jgi:parvulin-like peptidyl-prolyl isomerase|nr:peptidylprolyl isomerase [Elusimicrobiota bacterium]